MVLSISCHAGKIQLSDDGTLQVIQFGKVLWQSQASDVTGLMTQPSALMTFTVTIQTAQDSYVARMVSKPHFTKLQEAFPRIQAVAADPVSKPVKPTKPTKPTKPAKLEWYESPDALTHVATYTKEKEMQRDLEAAYQHGWIIQGQSSVGSHVNVGRSVTKFVLTGGIGLMTGVSRSKEKTTITYVRTPEWIAEHR